MAYETKLPRQACSSTVVTEDFDEGSEVFPVALALIPCPRAQPQRCRVSPLRVWDPLEAVRAVTKVWGPL